MAKNSRLGLFLTSGNTFNLGIGTTGPRAKAEIKVGTDLSLLFENVGNGFVRIYSLNDASTSNTPFELRGSILSLNGTGGGNLGIGTTGPGAKLEVVGNIRVAKGSNSGLISWVTSVLYKTFCLIISNSISSEIIPT